MSLRCLSPRETEEVLPYPGLIEALKAASVQYENGEISCPERALLPMAGEAKLISMPAAAADLGVEKLISYCPENVKRGRPRIQGTVSVFSGTTGEPLVVLDGPTVTARRTASMSLLALMLFAEDARHIAVVGTGVQAAAHIEALSTIFPGTLVDVHGISLQEAERFCTRFKELPLALNARVGAIAADVQAVISVTTCTEPFYCEPAKAGRLLVGVGAFTAQMAEYHPSTVLGSDLVIDDAVGGRHEAGDLIQAGVDWQKVRSVGQVLVSGFVPQRPVFFKSVGCAAWDLAAARCALEHLGLPA